MDENIICPGKGSQHCGGAVFCEETVRDESEFELLFGHTLTINQTQNNKNKNKNGPFSMTACARKK